MKRASFIFVLILLPFSGWADNYKIQAIVGGKTVNIGGKVCAEGAVFSDNDVISWASDKQILKVCALDGKNKGRTIKISRRAFSDRGAKTMHRYVNMIGRGIGDETPIYVLGANDTDTLTISINPALNYQLWFDTNAVVLNPHNGKLIISSSLIGCGDRMVDAWVVSVNSSTGDMTPCYHCMIDLAYDASSNFMSKGEKRLALVVANANYLDPQDRLNTPISDAREVAWRLEELDFRVVKAFDKNYENMAEIIKMFGSLSAYYDVAVFYYSGHGAQGRALSGEIGNYLVPINVTIRGNDDVVGRCLSLASVSDAFAQLNTKCAVRMLFIDACRNIPTQRNNIGRGVMAADYPDCWAFFSTASGSRSDDGQAKHSPFTEAWLESTAIKDISLGSLFPAISSRLYELTNGEQKASLTCNSSANWTFSKTGKPITKKGDDTPAEPGIDSYRQATAMFAAGKYDEAVNLFLIAAKEGNHQAQGALGYCYYYGRGVDVNYTEAVHWYFEAASYGIDYAQNGLGMCYMNGKGVEQNYKEAVRWYSAAAAQGDEYAQYFLGICFSLGMGTDQDYTKAALWFTKSALQGNADAQEALASCFFNGVGVDKDDSVATEWYIKAARGGNYSARKRLNEMNVSWQ